MKKISIAMIIVGVLIISVIFGAGLFSTLDTYNGISCEPPAFPTGSETFIKGYQDFCEAETGSPVFIDTNGEGFWWANPTVYCYHCNGNDIGDTEIWNDNNPCKDDSYYDGQVPVADVLAYGSDGIQDQEYCYEEPATPDTVTCYQCISGTDGIDIKDYEGSCPSGWTTNNNIVCSADDPTPDDPVDDNEIVTCYACQDGELLERGFYQECGIGFTKQVPTCAIQSVTNCYNCENGVVNSYDSQGEVCVTGYSDIFPSTCEADCNVVCDVKAFYNENPTNFFLIILAIIMISIAIIITVTSPKQQKPQGVVRL